MTPAPTSDIAGQPPPSIQRTAMPDVIGWLTAVAICAVYVWVVYSPYFVNRKNHSADYNTLADAFLSGHTYLKMTPSARLLALPDPYNPIQNAGLVQRDLSLYHGRFYWYLGPVPALVQVCLKALLGKSVVIGDHILVLLFLVGAIISATGIILRARRTLFPDAPTFIVPAAIVAVGMSLPLMWLAGHPYLLESAIAGGQCFLLLGLFLATTALAPNQANCDRLALAGAAWALACGCRISLAPAVAALTLLTLIELRPHGALASAGRQRVWRSASLLAPLLAGAAALALYNRARFDSWTQTGWDYQLAWMNHHTAAGKRLLMSPRYVPPNLCRYFFELPACISKFPFLALQDGQNGLDLAFHMPVPIVLEPVGGLYWSVPFVTLLLGLLPARSQRSGGPGNEAAHANAPAFRWLARCLLCGGVFALAPVFLGVGSTERYLADGVPCLLLVAALGAWRLYENGAGVRRQRWLATTLIVGFSAFTAFFGYLLILAR